MTRTLRPMADDIADAPYGGHAWMRVFRALDRAERKGEETGDWTAFQEIAVPLAARYHTEDYRGEKMVDDQLSQWRALNR